MPPNTSLVSGRIGDVVDAGNVQILHLTLAAVEIEEGHPLLIRRTGLRKRDDIILQGDGDGFGDDERIGPVVEGVGDVIPVQGRGDAEEVIVRSTAVSSSEVVGVAGKYGVAVDGCLSLNLIGVSLRTVEDGRI